MNRLLLIFLVIASSSAFADTLINGSQLHKWGYVTLKDSLYNESFCDDFTNAKKAMYQSIKSLNSVEGDPYTYYRFTLVKEYYGSSKLAAVRNNELRNPTRRSSKHSKLCNIRKSFFIGNKVFFVHTDVGMFRSELDRIMELLRESAKKP